MTDRDDLLWIGSRLCAALDRAGRAERRVAELEEIEAAALCALDVARPIAAQLPPGLNDKLAYLNLVTVIRPALQATQDAPEPPQATSTRPDVPDAPGGVQEAPLPVERLWQTRLRVNLPDPDADP